MSSPGSFPDEQAEVVFSDIFVEYLESLTRRQAEDVVVEVLRLCSNPAGTHRLGNKSGKLAGWNTLYVLGGQHRVVFSSRVLNGVGVIEVLCGGPRRENAVYDLAVNLAASGKLTDEEVNELWLMLTLLRITAEQVGLDGWDYVPEPAPEGMQRAAVKLGLFTEEEAATLSLRELEAAMTAGWDADGNPDAQLALTAALQEARLGVDPGDVTRVLQGRLQPRCGAVLPVAKVPCIRRAGHPGPHRSKY